MYMYMYMYMYVYVSLDAVFGARGDKRSQMPIQVSSVTAAHNSLWIGTENGILITFPFNAPSIVAEETGWEVIKVHVHVHTECQLTVYQRFTNLTVYIYMYMWNLHAKLDSTC